MREYKLFERQAKPISMPGVVVTLQIHYWEKKELSVEEWVALCKSTVEWVQKEMMAEQERVESERAK